MLQLGGTLVHPPARSQPAGQSMLLLQASAPVHSTLHPQESAQSTSVQERRPVHTSEHGPVPQVTLSHAPVPVQVTVQSRPPAQSMDEQLLAAHAMVQPQPGGQVTSPQLRLVQSMMQRPLSQAEHAGGQVPPGVSLPDSTQ